MTTAHPQVEEFVPLLDFIKENLRADDAPSLAQRIGLTSKLTALLPGQRAVDIWQIVLDAALANDRITDFLEQVSKLVGKADRPAYEEAIKACGLVQIQTILRREHPELDSVCAQLAAARTLDELGVAADAARTQVLRVLAAVEVGSPERVTILAAFTGTELDRHANCIGTLALNVMTILDRLLDLTESGAESSTGVQLLTQQHPDDFGISEQPAAGDPQRLMLARNARAAAWTHMQRLLRELIPSTVYTPGSYGP